jgi:hypothetical protein
MKRLNLLLLVLSVCAVTLFTSCAATTAAPPPREEIVSVRPHPQAVWVPGHWKWSFWRHHWVWVRGHWRMR